MRRYPGRMATLVRAVSELAGMGEADLRCSAGKPTVGPRRIPRCRLPRRAESARDGVYGLDQLAQNLIVLIGTPIPDQPNLAFVKQTQRRRT